MGDTPISIVRAPRPIVERVLNATKLFLTDTESLKIEIWITRGNRERGEHRASACGDNSQSSPSRKIQDILCSFASSNPKATKRHSPSQEVSVSGGWNGKPACGTI